MHRRPTLASKCGFTTIESMIVLLLVAAIAGGVATTMRRSLDSFEQGASRGDLNARSARVMARITQELIGARTSNMTPFPVPPAGSDNLEFERLVDSVGDALVWGPRRQIRLQLGSGELDNGLDDNGNGAVDCADSSCGWSSSCP